MATSKMLLAIGWIICFAAQNTHAQQSNNSPVLFTLIIGYVSCTDCSDFYVDSGQVIVPMHLRQRYTEARYHSLRLYGRTLKQVQERLAANGYRDSILKTYTESAYDSLFTPPWRTYRNPIPESEDRSIQQAYWRRRYRVTGTVVGFDGRYLIFKVQKAIRLSDKVN